MFVKAFLAELKDRKVIQVAVVYLVAGWVIMQVADVMFPVLGLPDWSIKLVAALLILGFPHATRRVISTHCAVANASHSINASAEILVESSLQLLLNAFRGDRRREAIANASHSINASAEGSVT